MVFGGFPLSRKQWLSLHFPEKFLRVLIFQLTGCYSIKTISAIPSGTSSLLQHCTGSGSEHMAVAVLWKCLLFCTGWDAFAWKGLPQCSYFRNPLKHNISQVKDISSCNIANTNGLIGGNDDTFLEINIIFYKTLQKVAEQFPEF